MAQQVFLEALFLFCNKKVIDRDLINYKLQIVSCVYFLIYSFFNSLISESVYFICSVQLDSTECQKDLDHNNVHLMSGFFLNAIIFRSLV